jgi:hypothetical protein
MTSFHLRERLAHPHYFLNVLLSLPLPLLLLNAGVDTNTALALVAAPVLLFGSLFTRGGFGDAGASSGGRDEGRRRSLTRLRSFCCCGAETALELVTWNLKVFNTFGLFFTRLWLNLTTWHVAAYVGVWFSAYSLNGVS